MAPVGRDPGAQHRSWWQTWFDNRDFRKFLRFGLIDQCVLLFSTAIGFSFDAIVARKIGVQGYGVLLGAGIGNVVSDAVAAVPEGYASVVGVASGGSLMMLPVLGLAGMRIPMHARSKFFLFTLTGVTWSGCMVWSHYYDQPSDDQTETD